MHALEAPALASHAVGQILNEPGLLVHACIANRAICRMRNRQDQLTPREKEILIMICEQYSTEDIAKILFVSPLTVNNHRRSILAKTGAKNVAGMVVYAVKNGLFRIE